MNAILACVAVVMLQQPAPAATGTVIDRLLAVVDRQPVMLSDVAAALTFGLVKPPAGVDPIENTVDRLIERDLMLIEVERYQPEEPQAALVEQKFAAIEAAAGGAASLDRRLAAVGYSREQLRQWIRNDLRIQSYINQRFGAAAQPGDVELAAYYRQHPEEFTVNGQLRPFNEVADALRARLAAERRTQQIDEWLASLRRRANIAQNAIRE